MKLKNVFQRKETKYILDEEKFHAFFHDLQEEMQVDEYGQHTILSLYFDTDDFQLIRKSMDKPVYKEKFRIRAYGVPCEGSMIFLEIKKKVQGIVYKRRVPMQYEEYVHWLETGEFPVHTGNVTSISKQIEEEITWLFKQNKNLQPKVLIAYDRVSLFDKEDGEFRVTFDQNIRYRNDHLALVQGDVGEPVAPGLGILMEVKALGAYPLWFVALLDKYEIRKSSFSKYAETYERHLFKQEDIIHVH
ncbi:polyphosphate polymerase domain-containing protein [Aerococcus agrisoli]|uniref:Polyphosphate polymerase domain-containing protein n=1 Tax=Aerococcus agrisoli TaxID=2487350 RepID=A0A3N4H0Z2_9LACT|nr:polyphosphate polymerase domain-containing protein [Aerococcus agrisoli]RPA65011.1 polyphosphate polymerase domain-containing protein [Aerococcus agrisoli]